jgi:hypothetical protein
MTTEINIHTPANDNDHGENGHHLTEQSAESQETAQLAANTSQGGETAMDTQIEICAPTDDGSGDEETCNLTEVAVESRESIPVTEDTTRGRAKDLDRRVVIYARVGSKDRLGITSEQRKMSIEMLIRASIAEHERRQAIERVLKGRRLAVQRGQIMLHGNRPPFGYRVSDDGATLVVDEDQAQTVRLIYTWYTKGDESGKLLSSRKIAERLTALQMPTWADIHCARKKRAYGQWSWQTIISILRSETYAGRWFYGRRNARTGRMNPRDQWIRLDVPAIVSEEVWQRAQEQRRENRPIRQKIVDEPCRSESDSGQSSGNRPGPETK